ncbi:MAG: hypothetical protein JSU92_05540 [Deltaproteobacteria bacterium]|nr:MAG: hypothetical protein JSU92_05540 [Deltaproteobacteria bacterium]
MKNQVESVGFVRGCFIFASVLSMILMMSSDVNAFLTGNVNVFLGGKTLDDSWEPAEQQAEIGLQVDFRPRSWPINFVIDFLGGYGEGTLLGIECKSTTSEVNIGVRKIWEQFVYVRPFIGGGVSFIHGEFTGVPFGIEITDDDDGVGGWLGGGVYWTLAEHFNIGLEAKGSIAKLTLFGGDVNGGGGHFGMLIGGHW